MINVFSQLLQGEEVLRAIEQVPTRYESPLKDIEIVNCGEFSLTEGAMERPRELEQYLDSVGSKAGLHKNVEDFRDVASVMAEDRFKLGMYTLETDNRSYFPFCHLPDYFVCAMQYLEEPVTVLEEGGKNFSLSEGFWKRFNVFR